MAPGEAASSPPATGGKPQHDRRWRSPVPALLLAAVVAAALGSTCCGQELGSDGEPAANACNASPRCRQRLIRLRAMLQCNTCWRSGTPSRTGTPLQPPTTSAAGTAQCRHAAGRASHALTAPSHGCERPAQPPPLMHAAYSGHKRTGQHLPAALTSALGPACWRCRELPCLDYGDTFEFFCSVRAEGTLSPGLAGIRHVVASWMFAAWCDRPCCCLGCTLGAKSAPHSRPPLAGRCSWLTCRGSSWREPCRPAGAIPVHLWG